MTSERRRVNWRQTAATVLPFIGLWWALHSWMIGRADAKRVHDLSVKADTAFVFQLNRDFRAHQSKMVDAAALNSFMARTDTLLRALDGRTRAAIMWQTRMEPWIRAPRR